MEKKTRSLRLVLLLAVTGFAGLVWLTSQHNGTRTHGNSAEISYALNVELKWVATDENADFALVQDTLSYYAAAFGSESKAHSSEFRLDHCCGDLALREMWTNNADFYQLHFSTGFADPAARQRLLSGLIAQGYLRPGKTDFRFGLANGNVDLILPVPHQPGRVLEIRGSAFELSFLPRVQDVVADEPIA
ncbi:MAG: hypothetical protein IPN95_01190 [Bacteroidetes bacterium]|nr:hypothetical protein [Bacteroidota bacterium]